MKKLLMDIAKGLIKQGYEVHGGSDVWIYMQNDKGEYIKMV